MKLLLTITDALPLDQLNEEQIKELQTELSRLGYPVGEIDGLIGRKTKTAWAEFKTDTYQGNPDLIGQGSILKLKEISEELGDKKEHDFTSKKGTIDAITWECKAQGIGFKSQTAYVLATTEWETAQTFKPVREAFWMREEWRKKNFVYYPFYGRGLVQLTWLRNYQLYSKILGIDLVKNPDLAMDSNIALFILVHGFKTGTFTGRKITDYINENRTDFVGARRCINGTDKASTIANLAEKYLKLN